MDPREKRLQLRVYHYAGHEFLAAMRGVDRSAVAHRTAECLIDQIIAEDRMIRPATVEAAEHAVWRDLHRMFGWRNVAELEPRGSA
jgi:hypothetical protein